MHTGQLAVSAACKQSRLSLAASCSDGGLLKSRVESCMEMICGCHCQSVPLCSGRTRLGDGDLLAHHDVAGRDAPNDQAALEVVIV